MHDDRTCLVAPTPPFHVQAEKPLGRRQATTVAKRVTSGGANDDGAGPRNPWAQPPGGARDRGRRPTALDDLLRRARSGGGGGMAAAAVSSFPAAAVRAICGSAARGSCCSPGSRLTSFHVIGPQERGVVTYFGKYSGTLAPGWNTTLPAPIASVQVVDVNVIRTFQFPENGGANLVLTEDQYLVDLSYTVRWRIVDPQKYAFELKAPDDSVKSAAESAVRAVVANTSLDNVLGRGKGQIETQVTQAMQRVLDEYQSGIRIVGVSLNNASAPSAAMDAFKEVTVAQQEYAKNVNAARAYAQTVARERGGRGAVVRPRLRTIQARARSDSPPHVLRDDGTGAGPDQQDDHRAARRRALSADPAGPDACPARRREASDVQLAPQPDLARASSRCCS